MSSPTVGPNLKSKREKKLEQVFVNSLILGMNYALIALGLTLIFAIMNVLNFAHGQMYVLGGFITYYALQVLNLPFVVGLVASVVVLVLVGLLSERLLFRGGRGEIEKVGWSGRSGARSICGRPL